MSCGAERVYNKYDYETNSEDSDSLPVLKLTEWLAFEKRMAGLAAAGCFQMLREPHSSGPSWTTSQPTSFSQPLCDWKM